MNWMPSNDLIAQLGHGGWGALIVLGFYIFGRVWWGVGASLSWAAVKEFIWDAAVEKQGFSDNAHDFISYAIGVGGALALIGIWEIVKKLKEKP